VTRFSSPLGLEVSIGVRPVISSSSTTPNEYTSVLSFTLPYMKYSGAKYPKVPTTSLHGMCVAFVGPHFASPKSDNCKQFTNSKLEDTKMQGVLGLGHIILVAICAAFDNSCCNTSYLQFS
jgi:hypothetical protein